MNWPNMVEQVHGDSIATFSPDMKYRYRLVRVLRKPDHRRVIFIMLNPSTADAFKNDPTVARCCRYAKDWNYDSIEVLNIFAFRSTNPLALYTEKDPVGLCNDAMICSSVTSPFVDMVIAAWGTHGGFDGRGKAVADLVNIQCHRELHCLQMTKEFHPGHPLYLRADLLPVPYVSK